MPSAFGAPTTTNDLRPRSRVATAAPVLLSRSSPRIIRLAVGALRPFSLGAASATELTPPQASKTAAHSPRKKCFCIS
ncbi:MAG: hypothetical protein ACREQV_04885, partial [Candidatus Binatia bacterium]